MEIDVIIMGDGPGDGLQPLTHQTSCLLLPICGRSVIDHLFESLMPLCINQVTLLTNEHSGKVRKFVGKGDRWGMAVKLVTTLGATDIDTAISRYAASKERPCLLVDAMVFRSFDISRSMDRFEAANGEWLVGKHQGTPCGLSFYQPNDDAEQVNAIRDESAIEIELELEFCQDISTLKNYQSANFWVAEKKPKQVLTRGKQKYSNVVAGPGCIIAENNVKSGHLFTGMGCKLHPDVNCHGVVVMGNNVIVDRHTCITNSIILDETYIGEHLNIENSIVWRNTLISIDKNTSITLEDDRLISGLSRTAIQSHVESIFGRVMALLVLILSIPLWVMAFMDALFCKEYSLFKPVLYVGNGRSDQLSHGEFSGVEIRSRFRFLAKLPRLLEMVFGRIRWFGVSICTPEMLLNRSESWQFIRDSQPVGLIGPAQIELDNNPTIDERLLKDATLAEFGKSKLLINMIKKRLSYRPVTGLSSKVSSR